MSIMLICLVLQSWLGLSKKLEKKGRLKRFTLINQLKSCSNSYLVCSGGALLPKKMIE